MYRRLLLTPSQPTAALASAVPPTAKCNLTPSASSSTSTTLFLNDMYSLGTSATSSSKKCALCTVLLPRSPALMVVTFSPALPMPQSMPAWKSRHTAFFSSDALLVALLPYASLIFGSIRLIARRELGPKATPAPTSAKACADS